MMTAGLSRLAQAGCQSNATKVNMIEWSEKFETGHSTMDAEHRMLISYFNRLEEMAHVAHPTKDELEMFLHFVDFLENYIGMHFHDEEGLMKRFRCPAHKKNQEAHAEFKAFYHNFTERLKQEGCRPEMIKQLHQYCNQWIQGHILHVDVQMKPCQRECWNEEETE
jgi:hemerythrin